VGLSRTVGPNLRGVARPARVEDSRCAARPSEALVGVGLRKAEGAAEAAAGRARKDCGRGISPLRAVAARQLQVADDMFTSSALPPDVWATARQTIQPAEIPPAARSPLLVLCCDP